MATQIEKRKHDIEYLKILSQKLQNVPAWKDFALACQDVLGKNVDDRRRKLEKIRDTVKYRRGDTLVDVAYRPTEGPGKTAFNRALNNTPVDIPVDYKIRKAVVRNVVARVATFQDRNSTDFLELVFPYDKTEVTWYMPVQLPQERDALLKNAYIMGFDFFNTQLNDEDLQRVYQFIQTYWPESGTADNYLKFIGFIKNMRIDLVNLWSYDDDTDYFPELKERDENTVPAYEGGKHYLTNHVELKINIAQFGKFYNIDLTDLETLFYYFAPIIVVLERISLYLDFDTVDVAVASATQLVLSEHGGYDYDLVFEFVTNVICGTQMNLSAFAVLKDDKDYSIIVNVLAAAQTTAVFSASAKYS